MERLIEQMFDEVKRSRKRKIVCLSTTANINNPPLHVGGVRNTPTAICANFIFADLAWLRSVIEKFDGVADYFLLDCEWKNEAKDLQEVSRGLIQKSKILVYKPNDVTVEALDMWLAVMKPIQAGLRTAVLGCGNIGSKIGLKLAERGSTVLFWGRNRRRLEQVVSGLEIIKRGGGSFEISTEIHEVTRGADLLLGCTPGTPVVSARAISGLAPGALVIDVGNGTITEEGLREIERRNIRAYCLTPHAGFAGFMACWEQTREQLSRMHTKRVSSELTLISPGIIGGYGDVIVDDVESVGTVFGVCDGKGDTLPPGEAEPFLRRVERHVTGK